MATNHPLTFSEVAHACETMPVGSQQSPRVGDFGGWRTQVMPTVHKLNHVIDIGICATLSEDELKWLEAEVVRMDQEEPITNGWSKETVLEAMLQIAIDRARGVDEDPVIRDLKARLRNYEAGLGVEIKADIFWDDGWMAEVEKFHDDGSPLTECYPISNDGDIAFDKEDSTPAIVMLVDIELTTFAKFLRKAGVA